MPYDFLRLFLDNTFLQEISHKSKLYCIRKGAVDKESIMTPDNFLTAFGIMYMTGYLSPASRRMLWENREDTQNMLVKRAMSRNMFEDMVRYMYFVEPGDQDATDAFWKVRSLFNCINRAAKKYIAAPEFVSIDETIVRYFGPHPLKQAIRDKPERFGYKLWCMAAPTGELLRVQPYAGVKTHIADVGLGQGPNVIYGLSTQYGLKPGSKVACDNLFTSFDLLDHMADKGWGVVGTMRVNRLNDLQLPRKKTQESKKMARGEFVSLHTQNINVTVWKDSEAVTMASNFVGPHPTGVCQRYDGKERVYKNIPCPNMVLLYNKTMGGVDLVNQSTKNYYSTIRLKKWYWAIFTWFLSIQMMQAWRLYRSTWKLRHQDIRLQEDNEDRELEEEDLNRSFRREQAAKEREEVRSRRRKEEKKVEEIPLLNFIRDAVDMLLREHSDTRGDSIPQREVSSRPSNSIRQALRYDSTRQHLVLHTKITGVCQMCKKRTIYRCQTCNVALHPECFADYHTH